MDTHRRSVTNRLNTGQPTRHAETERGSERLREAERRNAEDIREADPMLVATGRQPATGGAVRSA